MRLWRKWKQNEEGQLAIFVALVFQVLFVFFAMAINVGMIVYQKINLQNAVDLAAYYGAMKQAEVLNTMAHINYQIRQSYKLLAYRYRVEGEFGRLQHPGSDTQVASRLQRGDVLYAPGGRTQFTPHVCISHAGYKNTESSENLCRDDNTYEIPVFGVPPVAFDPFGFGAAVRSTFSIARQTVQNRCKDAGKYNWLFGAAAMFVFRMDQMERRAWIEHLGDGLAFQPNDFIELTGDPASEGALKTLQKNLSESNYAGFVGWEMLNSLGDPRFGSEPKQRRSFWLTPIPIVIRAKYTFNQNTGSACVVGNNFLFQAPSEERLTATNGDQRMADTLLQASLDGPADFNNPMTMTMGYEKNPWFMAYVGVRAKTRPLKLFSPFAKDVVLSARAFAQPFGGRMGPWYNSGWVQGRDHFRSQSGTLVDPLMPIHPLDLGTVNLAQTDQVERFFPNYSRYPGDQFGLKSQLALTMVADKPPIDPMHIIQVINEYGDPSKPHDPLAWDRENDEPPLIRQYEDAVVAPDLFDATYYSIDPNYMKWVYPILQTRKRQRRLGSTPQYFPPADLGTRFGSKYAQLQTRTLREGLIERQAKPEFNRFYYYIGKWEHLLTGWASDQVSQYNFPSANYAKCPHKDTEQLPLYSGCAAGGRVGHSVKLVSKDYLDSSAHQLGGTEQSKAPLLNPPGPRDW